MLLVRYILPLFAVVSVATAAPPTLTAPPAGSQSAIEFYHAAFNHFFMTSLPDEIDALDSGRTVGWTRTGRAFAVFPFPPPAPPGISPVCRFYIPPQHGDSHFFSASPFECAEIRAKVLVDPNYSGYIEESPNVFYSQLPNLATGACPASTVPVYRLWNQRADSNHRYTTDAGIKASMIAQGYVAEGYGADATGMCTPAALLVDALTRASGTSPFTAGCDGVPANGTVYVGAEVEPYVAVNPANPNNVIAVWQQDRWSNGGSRGLAGAYSMDGGGTWTRTMAPFSRCSGGNANNNGNFERATDPWVTFAPNGTAHQIALAFNTLANGNNAILASRSTDGGQTWSTPLALRTDGADGFNDKEAITADPLDSNFVYVVWDRLAGIHGPAWFARTTDGGASWEPARIAYDPGDNSQTIGNVIVVLPDGTLVNQFTELANVGPQNARLRIVRSSDRGATWSAPITIAELQPVGTVDPETGTGIRDGSGIASIAVGRSGVLAVVWQDSRFAGGAYDGIALATSSDGGFNWSAPVRVNGAPAIPALLPAVSIRDDGTMGVVYYDLRSNTLDPNTLPTDTWLVESTNGTTWTERRIAPAFDYAKAPLAGGRYFIGDYVGIAQSGTTFMPLFPQTTANANNRTDIFLGLSQPSQVVPFMAGMTPDAAPTTQTAARIRQALRTAVTQRLPEAVAKRFGAEGAER